MPGVSQARAEGACAAEPLAAGGVRAGAGPGALATPYHADERAEGDGRQRGHRRDPPERRVEADRGDGSGGHRRADQVAPRLRALHQRVDPGELLGRHDGGQQRQGRREVSGVGDAEQPAEQRDRRDRWRGERDQGAQSEQDGDPEPGRGGCDTGGADAVDQYSRGEQERRSRQRHGHEYEPRGDPGFRQFEHEEREPYEEQRVDHGRQPLAHDQAAQVRVAERFARKGTGGRLRRHRRLPGARSGAVPRARLVRSNSRPYKGPCRRKARPGRATSPPTLQRLGLSRQT